MRSTRSSTSALESLPSELFLAVAEHADFESRLALSATNSRYRTFLLPIIFRTLKVTSDEGEANEVLEFAKKIGANVKAISFHGTAEPNLNEDEEEENDGDEQILPLAAAELLRGQHFPNMTTLIVHFEFDFENNDRSDDGVWDSRDDLSDGASMYEFPWRRLMAQTWAAASQNKNISELIVKDLIAKAVSLWFTAQWKTFLGQISVADIQIWGGDNGAGWEVGTLEGYMYFVAKMNEYFFDHMGNTKTLRLSCYEHGPLGSQWTGDEDTMALRPNCFPQLEHVHLDYVVLCPELVAFLEPKAATLKSVSLHECFASNQYGTIRLLWADFFTSIRRSEPKWTSFAVTNNHPPPLTFKEWQASRYPKEVEEEPAEQEPDHVQSVRADLAKEPNRRLFYYATLTDKYGDRWPDTDAIIHHFRAGRDMEEFEKLMDVVGKNYEAATA
ncbi:hypothetical protein K491DRAFT_606943 [Lophiostoma macrostomum CBS 122681]|uniref:F-box domain-containing protein n=1 Tax=Lophiostoma macrostomum CBS 122681 TaxID=1314788 RepID=A0A6A6SV17_9PLEO|nr:hypothetical protein K491DRAFT_606943 [Lophiostoma macrostomum CBS 122681]